MGMLIFIVLIFVFTDLLYIIYNKYITIYVLPLPIPEGLCIDDTTYQYCPQDVLWNEGIAHLRLILLNHWATERRVLKVLYKPMTKLYDNPIPRMKEQIARNFVHNLYSVKWFAKLYKLSL